MTVSNYLIEQRDQDNALPVNHNYLSRQFSDCDEILAKIREVVVRGDFTLGRAVGQFEERFAAAAGARHAIGVGSGTDAIFLSLKAAGIKDGDEVITTPFTFYATIGAIVTAGGLPVFVDVGEDCNINPGLIERAVTPRTRAIVPVHWSGKPCRMDAIQDIACRHGIAVIEDACHAITASYKGQNAGTFGTASAFSLHPLKNLNVWGDGGVICTNSGEFAARLRLMRNHGLSDRDTCEVFAYNSRLDTIQAVVGDHLLNKIEQITASRIANAQAFDRAFAGIPEVIIPPRDAGDVKQVYHIYSLRFERRDELQKHMIARGIDAKVHYPRPMHLQPAAEAFGHFRPGAFPMAEAIAGSTLSLPVHEFISEADRETIIAAVREFYT